MQPTEQLTEIYGGLITAVEPRSLGAKLKLQAGDVLLSVNGSPVQDVIDVQYYAADNYVEVTFLRGEETLTRSAARRPMQPLGLSFEHPTFDIDIRRCNNLCEFCFVLQMAPRFRRTLYIKDDDYRYSFLFGHYVTLTNLSPHDEQRIVEQGLSPLYVSVHAADLELRRAYLRNPHAPDIVPQLKHFISQGITFHTQIVVTPGVNDGQHLERSINELAQLFPGVQSVTVVPVGLTRHHKYQMRPHTPSEAADVLDHCEAWQAAFRARFGVNFIYATDEWYLVTGRPLPPSEAVDGLDLRENGLGMVRHFMDEWAASQQELASPERQRLPQRLTLATASLFAPVLHQHAQEFTALSGVETEVVSIRNMQLGESITVAGLLMGQDVINQLEGRPLGDVVVLPRVMFDHPQGVALDDKSPLDIAKALGRPVALADLMGDLIDLISGRPALYFDPDGDNLIPPQDIKLDGGWAVEKYL